MIQKIRYTKNACQIEWLPQTIIQAIGRIKRSIYGIISVSSIFFFHILFLKKPYTATKIPIQTTEM